MAGKKLAINEKCSIKENENLISVKALAKMLRFSKKTIHRMTASKSIPFYRLGTGKKGIRFKLAT